MSECQLPVALAREYKNGNLDLTHHGYLTIVDSQSNVVFSMGSPQAMVFYRSSSKPLQALPVIVRGLDKKYGLTDQETAIFSGSHAGEEIHVAVLESILAKTGLSEDLLVMKPAVPYNTQANEARIRAGLPPRKLYHNCAGKHIALMLVQRQLGAPVEDYWRPDAPVQSEVMDTIRQMGEEDRMETGLDGCGVPVFMSTIKSMAVAFKNLARPGMISQPQLRAAAEEYAPRLNRYPLMMRGTGDLCSLLNYDSNIVAKGGAAGVYAFGLREQGLGVAFKMTDGTENAWPLMAMEVLRAAGALTAETRQRLMSLGPVESRNDNGDVAGVRKLAFEIKL